MWRVMYSTVTGSSTVRRWDWHSMRARSIRMRASAVRPVAEGGEEVSLGGLEEREGGRERRGRTGEAEADVVVEHGRLAHGARVLQLEDALLLDGEDDAVLAADADRASSFPDGLEGIVDLQESESV